MAAVGGWVAFPEWGSVSLGEIEQEKASKPWPRVICTSRVTSLGPLGCHTMQRILDLFTPHLASKATAMGGGRGRVKDWDHGSICRRWTRRESSASLLNTSARSADSRLGPTGSWRRANNCTGTRGRCAPVPRQTGHTQRLQAGRDL